MKKNNSTKKRNLLYLLYIISRGISAFGTQASFIAANYWFVYQIDSGILMGLGNSLPALVILLVAPWGGMMADQNHNNRLSQIKRLYIYDLGNFLIALTLFFILFSEKIPVIIIIICFITLRCMIVAISALAHPLESSIKQAFQYYISKDGNMIEKMNTIYFAVINVSGVIGQVVSVLFAAGFSYVILFFIDSLSFLAAGAFILCLLFLLKKIKTRLDSRSSDIVNTGISVQNLISSFKTIIKHPLLKTIFFIMLFTNFGFSATPIILGFYIKRELALDPVWFGYFIVVFQIGGALIISIKSFFNFKTTRPLNIISLYLLGLVILSFLFYFVRNTYILLFLCFMTGIQASMITILIETIIDEYCPPHLRGRVESHFWITNNIMKPVSMGFSGLLIDMFNIKISMIFLMIGLIYLAIFLYGISKIKSAATASQTF